MKQLFIVNTLPFIGFGFLDNFLMIVAAEYIEHVCIHMEHLNTSVAISKSIKLITFTRIYSLFLVSTLKKTVTLVIWERM